MIELMLIIFYNGWFDSLSWNVLNIYTIEPLVLRYWIKLCGQLPLYQESIWESQIPNHVFCSIGTYIQIKLTGSWVECRQPVGNMHKLVRHSLWFLNLWTPYCSQTSRCSFPWWIFHLKCNTTTIIRDLLISWNMLYILLWVES